MIEPKYGHCHPSHITIPPGRERKEFKKLDELAASMFNNGQQVPIIITPSFILLEGERRMKAAKLIYEGFTYNGRSYLPDQSWEIEYKIALQDVSTEDQQKIIEIICNKHREQFTWEEDIRATEKLHQILSKNKPDWSMRKTAEETGISLHKVSDEVNLSKALEAKPVLFEKCKSKADALKVIKDMRLKEMMQEVARRGAKTDYGIKASSIIFQGKDTDLIQMIPDRSIYALIADPMYGVGIDSEMRADKQNEGMKALDDSVKTFRPNMELFAQLANPKLGEDSIVCLFTAFENVEWLNKLWLQYGYRMDTVPMIWVKPGSHYTNTPSIYFGKSYEFIVYGVRGNATLVKGGAANSLIFPIVTSTEKTHAYEKPLALMDELINRFCLPGQTILDNQCGSGTTIVSAIKRGCKAIGFEMNQDNYNKAIVRVSEALKAKDSGLIGKVGG